MITAPTITDALDAMRRLTSEQILGRLSDLSVEEAQLRAALRVVRARERAERIARTGRPQAVSRG